VGIRAAMVALATLEAGLSISSPITASVKRTYALPPNRKDALPDTPCWINGWTLVRQDKTFPPLPTRGPRYYAINAQLFVRDADLNRGADIATAFHEAFDDALDASTAWNDAVMDWDLRGGDPTLALLEWAGEGYPGLNLLLDVVLP
jgi:hypothetical protein